MPPRPLLALLLLFVSAFAGAHPANVASALAKVRPDGTFDVRLRFDILALVVGETPTNVGNGPMDALLDGPPADLEARLKEARVRLLKDAVVIGAESVRLARFPDAAEVGRSRGLSRLSRLPVMGEAVLTGKLKTGGRTIAFRFPEVLDTVVLTVEFPYREPISEPLTPGATSATLAVPTEAETRSLAASMGVTLPAATSPPKPPVPKPPVPKPPAPKVSPKPTAVLPSTPPIPAQRLTADDEGPILRSLRDAALALAPQPAASNPPPTSPPPSVAPTLETPPPAAPDREIPAPAVAPAERSPLAYIPRYVVMGYRHILPEGVDHIVFILGLFLLGAKLKPLLAQVTAFTLAHSLTLGLALFGIVRLPAAIVEPIIALSIVFVAVENIWAKEVKPWRLGVVFGFGLIHGLGFAGALQELGLGRRDLLPALVGFNVGVELGQLSVVALALLAVGWARGKPWYRPYVVIPASALIAAVALFWTVQRIFL